MSQHRAIRHHEFGKPQDVLQLETVATPEPGPGQVRVQLLAATINPSDYGMIGGSYGRLRALPAVAGREGVGVVDALGPGVRGPARGTRVRFPEAGCWQDAACVDAADLLVVPDAVPDEQAAVSFINPPTAYCLLTRMVDLPAGSWIVQNAGNSAVGVAVIQMARALGFKTISQVRREELVAPLQALGADRVVLEGSGWEKIRAELTGGAPLRLALNSIGGRSAIDQIKALAEGGTQVTFGGMVGEPVRFPTRYLIFNDVRLAGFWWDQWCRQQGRAAVCAVMDAVHGMMRAGSLQIPIEAKYSLAEYKDALRRDRQPRLGKVLLVP